MVDNQFPASALPAGGFLSKSLEYAKPLTEAEAQLHLGSSLVTLAMSVGRKAWVEWGDKAIYPNLYICLIGQSTLSRKSTSMEIQKRILWDFNQDAVLPEQWSYERLITGLSEKPKGAFYIDEFGGFLSACANKTYMAGSVELLTELYNCRPIRRELQSKKYEIHDPFVSVLACSTLDWLMKNIQERDIRGGFFPRFLFFVSRNIGDPIPRPPTPNRELRRNMIEDLYKIGGIDGPMTISPAASARYDSFYILNFEDAKNDGDSLLSGSYGRMTDYIIKIAMLYELSGGGGISRVISEDSMNRAIKLMKHLKQSLKNLVRNEMTFTPEMETQKKIMNLVNKTPGLTKSELLRQSRLPAFQFDRILNTLLQSEKIKWMKIKPELSDKRVTLFYPFSFELEKPETKDAF